MGDMDNFYLNPALRTFDEMLQKMKNPESDVTIIFEPMQGHCNGYNERTVLSQIKERIQKK
jgi:hypothetical protein